MTVEELSRLLHSKTRGKLLFGYISCTSMILLLSAMLTLRLIYDSTLPEDVADTLHIEFFFKDALILGGSFLIILSQIWEEKKQQQLEAIGSDLKKERQFRENSQGDTLLRFSFDVSMGEIVEGQWFFVTPEVEDDQDMVTLLEEFRRNGIHEGERSRFIPLKELEDHRDGLYIPSHTFNARLSVDYLLNHMNLPDSAGNSLRELEKEWVWTRVQITIVEDEESGDIVCHLSFYNIDAEVSHSQKLEMEARTDALTGLYNRAAIESRMKELFEDPGVSGALFIVDMDYFKSVNDTLGHPAGDKALQEVAEVLCSEFRGRDFIARLGGDEFCVFASNFTEAELVQERARVLNQKGRKSHYSPDGSREVNTSFSIGVAICEEDWKGTYEELYRRADRALYEAKEAGRNTYRLYSPAMEKE